VIIMLSRRVFAGLLPLPFMFGGGRACAQQMPVQVFAASSLKDVLSEIGFLFKAETGTGVSVALAGSSQLAKQIEAGAPADVFIPADQIWMDWLAARKLIRPDTRRNVAGNALVLITQASNMTVIDPANWSAFPALLGAGRLAIGQPESVPAGRYARQALSSLGIWDALAGRTAETENVHAALVLVSRGEAPFGIVYATDALADPSVRIAARIADASHEPVLYPAVVTSSSAHPLAEAFCSFLVSGKARGAFERAGFTVPDA
jgi:molybdate transport system substrate-binding protein